MWLLHHDKLKFKTHMANIGKSVKLGVFTLAIMNVTAVVSLRGLPA